MRTFSVKVNGVPYEVEIEEVVSGGAAAAQQPAAPAPAPYVQPAAAPKAAVQAKAGEQIKAPMPGTILDVKTSVGANVKKGDVLLVLEAMKMENEIVASKDGAVVQVLVGKGAAVNSGDVLVVLQ